MRNGEKSPKFALGLGKRGNRPSWYWHGFFPTQGRKSCQSEIALMLWWLIASSSLRLACNSRMVDFRTLTATSNVDWTVSTFPTPSTSKPMFHQKINDLCNPGFGLWFALSLSKGKRTGSKVWAHWTGDASCWVDFETRLANEPLLPPVMPLRTRRVPREKRARQSPETPREIGSHA